MSGGPLGTICKSTGTVSVPFTALEVNVIEPELVPQAIALLGELLSRPRFADIELERELILEEINEDYDEQGVEINADDIARGLVFGEHPLGQRIIGPRSNVERFSLADISVGVVTYRWLALPIEREPLPNLQRWYAGLSARPAFVASVPV